MILLENCRLPLERIHSALPIVVYSVATRQLLSQHRTRGDALKALSHRLLVDAESDAAIFERGEEWNCILRCPLTHSHWVNEMQRRLGTKQQRHELGSIPK